MSAAISWGAHVLARQVTEDNVAELAAWCGGWAHESYYPSPAVAPPGGFSLSMANALLKASYLPAIFEQMNGEPMPAERVALLNNEAAVELAATKEKQRLDQTAPRLGPWPRVPGYVEVPEPDAEFEYDSDSQRACEGDWIVRVEVTPAVVTWMVLDDADLAGLRSGQMSFGP